MELLWTDFLNSESHGGKDRLADPQWVADFLARWDLPVPPGRPGEEIRRLRTLIRRIAEAPLTADAASLNPFLARGPVRRELVDGQLHLIPVDSGWPAVAAEIAADFARTLAEGDPTRIRFCENPDCHWAFYDDTRNRTKRFCEERTCGNLMRVRRFRARRHQGR